MKACAFAFTVLGIAVLVGCNRPAGPAAAHSAGTAEEEHHHHHHEESDSLFWQRQDLKVGDYLVSLGHHGPHLHAGEPSEPAVAITKDGTPVTDAAVFVTVLDAAGQKVLVPETAQTYEAPSGNEPGHYACEVTVPVEAHEVTLKYRVKLPGVEQDFVKEVPVEAEHH